MRERHDAQRNSCDVTNWGDHIVKEIAPKGVFHMLDHRLIIIGIWNDLGTRLTKQMRRSQPTTGKTRKTLAYLGLLVPDPYQYLIHMGP